MNQALDQQDMVSAYIRFVTEKDLQDLSSVVALLAVLRLDELAHHGHIQGPHQISHEHE